MSTIVSATKSAIAKRCASRLNAALDRLGYPALSADRARALCTELEVNLAMASALLAGLLLPEWDVLITLCILTNRQPGYFLDESITTVPAGTKVIKALGPGENIVLSMPSGKNALTVPASADWTYITAKADMGFGVSKGDLVVNYSLEPEPPMVVKDHLYILSIDAHFEIRRCVDISNGIALLYGSELNTRNALPMVITVGKNGTLIPRFFEQSGVQYFGTITALVRALH